ncbi:copper chaperone PCu(A)C [Blastococcus sp. TML/M2B]|uniref:copper chaperone PCu(A)C n=1 Tax=unclassified Blastococcus TaxID=2619396 RepID=UPI00190A7320|nr:MULTISPECIES: copper chaperone PCu(A)C [unclassified Blastococcus]MBN1091441.1 copper chaperone PCu(A)C [Blastococcus sp. TML/M2B]MBN1095003.1 copper chaperone PCu(A)C [Blastococcus sp. TML/C7B]
MNRALRAAIVGVALFSPIALSACSAGQVAQTATQERDKVGAMGEVGDILLRQVHLAFPRSGSYDAGDDAEVTMAIVNTGGEADTLVSVEGEGFGDAEIQDGSATGASTGSARSGGLEVPAGGTVFVGSDDATITLSDLDEDLTVGQAVSLVLTFENAGEVTVRATVATPSSELEREEGFDFHHSEE